MKKALLAAIFVTLLASRCLAQEDSLGAVPASPAPALSGDNNHSSDFQNGLGKTISRSNWVLGFETASLALKDLPGTVFLQRRISEKWHLGLGFHYYVSHEGPNEDYYPTDSVRNISERKNSVLSIKPELSWRVILKKSCAMGIALTFDITKSFFNYSNEHRDESYYRHYTLENIDDYTYEYGMGIPFYIEKHFKIWKHPVSLGIKNNIFSIGGGWEKHKHCYEYNDEYYNYFGLGGHEDTDQLPKTITIDNPFQGKMDLVFKFYF